MHLRSGGDIGVSCEIGNLNMFIGDLEFLDQNGLVDLIRSTITAGSIT